MAVTFVLVRIDDRLIHGQVAVGWVKAMQPNHIIVVNDHAADDPIQTSMLEIATPPQLGVTICHVHEIAMVCKQDDLDGKRVLILFSSPKDVWQAIESGLTFANLNIGGMRYSQGKKQVMQAVAINEEDISFFRKIKASNISIEIKMVPTDEAVTLDQYL